jgi:hypothetical protein
MPETGHPPYIGDIPEAKVREALDLAEGWARYGYTVESRAYWRGMRDTLRVLLGVTTEAPRLTGAGTDQAASTLLH